MADFRKAAGICGQTLSIVFASSSLDKISSHIVGSQKIVERITESNFVYTFAPAGMTLRLTTISRIGFESPTINTYPDMFHNNHLTKSVKSETEFCLRPERRYFCIG